MQDFNCTLTHKTQPVFSTYKDFCLSLLGNILSEKIKLFKDRLIDLN